MGSTFTNHVGVGVIGSGVWLAEKTTPSTLLVWYLAAFGFAPPYERGEEGKREVDKIIFTGGYGQPYIYALFVRQTNPIWYQGGSLAKYEFKDEVTIGDLERENKLVVASNQDDLLGAGTKADKV